MRFIVTGAAGFIGSHLTEALLADGHDVTAVDCFTDFYDPRLKNRNASSFPVEQIDLTVSSLVLTAIDGIFHLAGQPGPRGSARERGLYLHRNVVASRRVFDSAAAAGIRVVFSSSSAVYGEQEFYPTSESATPLPRSHYGLSKLACEQMARLRQIQLGFDVVILRYFTVYGPRQRPDMFLARVCQSLIEDQHLVLYGDGSQSRTFTYVADVVKATIGSMMRAPSGTIYNVGGHEEVSVAEAISVLEHLADARVHVVRSPRDPADVKRTYADTTLIQAELGWEPSISFEEGLLAQWSWAARQIGSSHSGTGKRLFAADQLASP